MLNEAIIFATFVTDEEWLQRLAIPLQQSAHYFHPDIPFKIFGPEDVLQYYQRAPYLVHDPHLCVAPLMGVDLSQEYDNVVFFDADSLITAPLDEILAQDYQLAAPRNFSDHGALQNYPASFHGLQAFFYNGITAATSLNAGLVASRVKKFWHDWDVGCQQHVRQLFDRAQGVLNRIAYSHPYFQTFKLLDKPEDLWYYGPASTYGEHTAWDSWKTMYVKHDKLYMKNYYGIEKQIKVLHQAGGGQLGRADKKFDFDALFTAEVKDYLLGICS